MTSLPVPDSPVIRIVASEGATRSASVITAFMEGSLASMVLFSSVTAWITAAISSAFGGSGIYSFAPAFIAFTAVAASVLMPQATIGIAMRSFFSCSTIMAMLSLTSIMIRSAPRPERNAPSACSISSVCVTFAPRPMAILPAALICPLRLPMIINRMIVYFPLIALLTVGDRISRFPSSSRRGGLQQR